MTCEQCQQPDPHFHTFVCRRQQARAIATKACPGLRSGIDSRHSFRRFQRKRESRGVGMVSPVALGLVPRLGHYGSLGLRMNRTGMPTKPNVFVGARLGRGPGKPSPAGQSIFPAPIRHSRESMSRTPIRDVPSNQPRCRALHRRNVPNLRPMVDGGMRKCSAVRRLREARGLSPAGVRVGRRRIRDVPIRNTKPRLPALHALAFTACRFVDRWSMAE